MDSLAGDLTGTSGTSLFSSVLGDIVGHHDAHHLAGACAVRRGRGVAQPAAVDAVLTGPGWGGSSASGLRGLAAGER
jgi:hypothetical protein